MSTDTIIDIRDLSKTFRNATEPAVKGINLSIKKNEIFGLLGPNGAGKTTTISMLCGLYPPTSGNILINGQHFHQHLASLKKIIGIVPQDIALYPTLTARENLDFFGHMYGLKGKELKDRRESWLQKLGLTESGNRKIANFSGGMKRRVNLIAGLLHQPEILFLDEPTVGVDVQSRNVMIELLKDVNRSGTTIIYTSHHMEEAEDFCSTVSIIDYGRILDQGSPQELIARHPGSHDLEHVFLKLTKRKLRNG